MLKNISCIAMLSRFLAISTGAVYWIYSQRLKIDEEEFGGHSALLQEGLFASFTLFLVHNFHFSVNDISVKLRGKKTE
jgi:hypothetical protein